MVKQLLHMTQILSAGPQPRGNVSVSRLTCFSARSEAPSAILTLPSALPQATQEGLAALK